LFRLGVCLPEATPAKQQEDEKNTHGGIQHSRVRRVNHVSNCVHSQVRSQPPSKPAQNRISELSVFSTS
jgi:hypothetical protein